MKSIKILLATVFVSASSLAFGAGPKSDTKENETVNETSISPSEAKSQTTAFIYYVVSRDDDEGTYQLSTTSQPGCGLSGPDPCQITTTLAHPSMEISQSDVDNGVGVTVNTKRTL
ncbi:hypothetical protein AB6805_13655 [Chitinophaga sp. RCC_12]|uniref:hypothetical protein n=1 Tax=Chitinophaga sp. RCC_12 TaxID=3239226 RepID=UPI0035237DBA